MKAGARPREHLLVLSIRIAADYNPQAPHLSYVLQIAPIEHLGGS
jgi:hypothetical protein